MSDNTCCEVEAIVSFDERGQLVIPKDLRKKFNLKPGDKFALISCMTGDATDNCCSTGGEADAALCCFTLVHTSQLKGLVQQALGPMMGQLLKK